MDEIICPILSKPKQGDIVAVGGKRSAFGKSAPEPLYESEGEMKIYGWVVANGIPYSDVFPCITERCRAWDACKCICKLIDR